MPWIRCRVPETGAHISVEESALAAHPGLVRLDRPPTAQPQPDKPRRPQKSTTSSRRSRAAASTHKE